MLMNSSSICFSSFCKSSSLEQILKARIKIVRSVPRFQVLRAKEFQWRKLGETARRLSERIMEHAGKDKKLHMLKHTLQSGHPSVSPNDFRILQKGYNSNKVKRTISEALLIRKYRPSLNMHENSVSLERFN